MNVMVETWIDIGAADEIPLRGARLVRTHRGCIAIFRTGENEVLALDDRCPHKGGPLSQGIVHGKAVTCPLHNWVIDLETGQAQGADDGKVRAHRVLVQDGRLLLDPASVRGR
jgi:nitrite reductase (NADH) small subunit